MNIFNEWLINRSFYLRRFWSAMKIPLYSLYVLISWLTPSWFIYICWVYIFFIEMVAMVRCRITVRLKWYVMILGNMRNGICFGIKLPFTGLCVCLWCIFLKLIMINARLFAIANLLWNFYLRIRFRLKMLTTFIQSFSIKRILICLGVYRYIWPAIITPYSSKRIFISAELANCFLPLKICLWIVVFSYIDDCIIEIAWGLRIE